MVKLRTQFIWSSAFHAAKMGILNMAHGTFDSAKLEASSEKKLWSTPLVQDQSVKSVTEGGKVDSPGEAGTFVGS
ncbi:MAG: hypothetical protein ACOY45_03910 [Pseudomonadota bacterium]